MATEKKNEKSPIKKKTVKKFDKWTKYKFKANSKAPFMIDGNVYQITGEMAGIFIDKNYGEILD